MLATEEFDQLLFEYGLELDEDVRCSILIEHSTYLVDRRQLQKWRQQSRLVCLRNVQYGFYVL